jgi:hypothetical protein
MHLLPRHAPRGFAPVAAARSGEAVIDQLAEHVSVGSMQLNAYGEPLLHPISARS